MILFYLVYAMIKRNGKYNVSSKSIAIILQWRGDFVFHLVILLDID